MDSMKKLILFFVFVVFYVTGYSQVIKGTIFDSKTDSTICFCIGLFQRNLCWDPLRCERKF